jgi:hypothetical protein
MLVSMLRGKSCITSAERLLSRTYTVAIMRSNHEYKFVYRTESYIGYYFRLYIFSRQKLLGLDKGQVQHLNFAAHGKCKKDLMFV